MPNLRGASPVGRGEGGRSYVARTGSRVVGRYGRRRGDRVRVGSSVTLSGVAVSSGGYVIWGRRGERGAMREGLASLGDTREKGVGSAIPEDAEEVV